MTDVFEKPRARTVALLAVLVFAGSLVFLLRGIRVGPGVDTPPFHVDEASKLADTYFYQLFFEKRAWDDPAWSADFSARTNPPVAKYIFGAALAATGRRVADLELQHAFEQHWRRPDELRSFVPDELLRVTRATSAVFGALACALVALVIWRIAGYPAAAIGLLLVLGDATFRRTARAGLSDTVLYSFFLLIVPVSSAAARVLREHWTGGSGGSRRTRLRAFAFAVLVPGLVVGLATATKLNGALTGIAYAAVAFLAAASLRAPRLGARLGLALAVSALAAVVAAIVFVAVNPYFHTQPWARAQELLVVWSDWMAEQQIEPGVAFFSFRQKLASTLYATLLAPSLFPATVFGVVGTVAVSLGFTIGFAWLGSRLLRGARAGAGLPEEGVVAAWAATLFLGITCWIPLGWDRYYVPLLLVACVVAPIGLSRLPAIARQLHAASKSGVAAAERGRSAIATTATLVAWWLLAFAAWPLPPALVDPSQFFDALDREQVYRDAARAHPDSTLFRRHLGLVHLAHGRPREAALEFEAALRNAQLEPRPNRLRLIARCQISENLVRARLAAGDSARAAEALRIHLASLSRLRQGLRSRDERVVSEFERLIRERTQLLSQLTRR